MRACDVQLDTVYETVIAEGLVRALVTGRVPSDKQSRNERFHLVRSDTGTCLPRLKRASDLKTIEPRRTPNPGW